MTISAKKARIFAWIGVFLVTAASVVVPAAGATVVTREGSILHSSHSFETNDCTGTQFNLATGPVPIPVTGDCSAFRQAQCNPVLAEPGGATDGRNATIIDAEGFISPTNTTTLVEFTMTPSYALDDTPLDPPPPFWLIVKTFTASCGDTSPSFIVQTARTWGQPTNVHIPKSAKWIVAMTINGFALNTKVIARSLL